MDFLRAHFLGSFRDFHGVVADAFKIPNGVQQAGNLAAVRLGQAARRKADQIGAQAVFVYVDAGFGCLLYTSPSPRD